MKDGVKAIIASARTRERANAQHATDKARAADRIGHAMARAPRGLRRMYAFPD
jgi:hypothetical protein